jgi:hypothetical protein
MSSFLKIPNVIFQTSKNEQPEYVIELIKTNSPGWEYIHFTDDGIFKFFEENALDEFPNMKEKFLSIKTGAHRADLFRYYYLYINGGVFIDSDAIIKQDINVIAKDYDFFSVESNYFPDTIFNGFIGTTAKNIIMYEALKHAYHIDVDVLNKNYMTFCKQLREIYDTNKTGQNTLLYLEVENNEKSAKMINKKNEIVLIHYYLDKIVPDITKYRLRIKENIKPKIGITLSFPKSKADLFCNGIKQNALFFFILLSNINKYDVYFIVDKKSIENETFLHEMKYKYIQYDYIQETGFNIVFSFDFLLPSRINTLLKEIGTKHIFYNCGNLYIMDSENCLFENKDGNYAMYTRYNYFDECWNIPQMTNTNHFYLKTLLRCNTVKEVPFIWSPELIDYEKNKYKKRSERKSIAIFEPNMSIMKWAFPSVLICENAYRDSNITNKINKVYITNITTNPESKKKFSLDNFNNLVKCLDLKRDSKLTIEARHNSLYIMANFADIAVSHTWENYLNYLYFDMAWMGWPIVHNGKFCKEVGYYYDEFNYEMGGNVLKEAILNHDENANEYLLKNRLYMLKYLPTNKELKKQYEDLIASCLASE